MHTIEYVLKINQEQKGEPDVFVDIFDRFMKQDVFVKEQVQLLKGQIEAIDTSTSNFKFLVDAQKNVIEKTNDRITDFSEKLDTAIQNFKDTKISFIGQLQGVETKTNSGFSNIHKEITDLQQKAESARVDLVTHEQKFIDMNARLKTNADELLMLARNVGSLEATKLDTKKFQDKHKLTENLVDEMKKELAINENHLNMIENFIDKYLPIRVQSHMSEVMGNLYEKGTDEHIKLEEVEKRKFEELYEVILADDGIPNLMGRIDNIMNQVKESQEQDVSDSISSEEDAPVIRSKEKAVNGTVQDSSIAQRRKALDDLKDDEDDV